MVGDVVSDVAAFTCLFRGDDLGLDAFRFL